MYSIFHFLLLVASFISIALAVPAPISTSCTSSTSPPAATESSTVPIPPSQDLWYQQPPEDWQSATPGTILRIRQAPGNAVSQLGGTGYMAYNILYRTTDSHYNASRAVTTVITPSKLSTPHALISYQHMYDSVNLDDSPSYQIYSNDLLQLAVSIYLQAGWFVNILDYEGPNAAFGAGVTSGHAALDSVRTVLLASQIIAIHRDVQYAMYGYSGGSFATEWAAELQVQYAPELQFAGAGAGGAYPNVTDALFRLDQLSETDQSWLWHLSNVTAGIGNENVDVQAMAMSILGTHSWADTIQAVKAMSATLLQSFVNQLLQDATIQTILNRDGMMGYHGVPQMPLLLHRADQDELSPTSDTTKLYNEYCGVRANIYYHINPAHMGDPHVDEGKTGFGEAFGYFREMFGGTFPKGCQMVNATWS